MRRLSRFQWLVVGLILVVFISGLAALVGVAQPRALASLWPTTGPAPECGGYHPCHTTRPPRPTTPPTTPPASTPPVTASPSPSATPQLPLTGSPVNTLTVTGAALIVLGVVLAVKARRRPRPASRHRA